MVFQLSSLYEYLRNPAIGHDRFRRDLKTFLICSAVACSWAVFKGEDYGIRLEMLTSRILNSISTYLFN